MAKQNAGKPFPWTFLSLFLVSLAAGCFLYLWKRKIVYCLIPLVMFLVACFYTYLWESRRRSKENEEDEKQFVDLFSYFSIYIQDGFNVYNALEKVLPYAKGRLKSSLEGLLKEIEEDKTLAPYLSFASHFSSLEIKEVMLAVYQMVDQGTGGVYLLQFQRLFAKISEQKKERLEQAHQERLDTLNFLPLIGGGLSMLMLMLALLEIMGGMLNGL